MTVTELQAQMNTRKSSVVTVSCPRCRAHLVVTARARGLGKIMRQVQAAHDASCRG